MRTRPLLLTTALAAGLLTAVPMSAAEAATTSVESDFNGDGYADLAVGAYYASVGDKQGAGAVVVLYGSSSGPSAARRTVINQDSPGIPGVAEDGDLFGGSVTSADLNRDGYSDLIVGSTGEAVGEYDSRGSVTIVWGGRSGLTATGAGLPVPAEFGEIAMFGQKISAGDIDGDGDTDLSVTSRDGLTHYEGPFTTSGSPTARRVEERFGQWEDLAMGDMTGDGIDETVLTSGSIDGDVNGVVYVKLPAEVSDNEDDVAIELPDSDGLAVALGDVNGDGYDDAVLGSPDDPHTGETGSLGGQLSVWYGGPDGRAIADRKPLVINQNSANVPGSSESGDRFGASVSVGDVNGDGFADVMVGAPGENLTTGSDQGMITVFRGSAAGLTTTGSYSLTQDSANVPGAGESNDLFGWSTALTDLNKDGKADLAIGAPSENDGIGMVTTLRTTTTGASATGAFTLTGNAAGLPAGSSGFSIALH